MTIDTSREAVERLLDGVTPGPWEWGGYPDDLRLQTVHSGNLFVMTFARKGSRSAQPRFQQQDKGMVNADELLKFQVGDRDVVGEKTARENGSVYRYDVRGIDHPDARFIAAARDLVPALLAERDAALAEVARLSTPPDHLALVAAAYRDAAGLPAFDCTRTPADAEAHLTALLRAEYERGKAEVQGDTFYILEWMAGARPPVHPNPMRGRQSFRTPKEAIAFFKRQASDAQFLSLTKRVFLIEDCTPQALALLTQEGR